MPILEKYVNDSGYIMEEISIALRGIRAEELSFKQNNVKLPKDTKLDLKPSFSRRIRRTPENEKLYFVTLEVKIESSEACPKPFDLKVSLTGIFEASLTDDMSRRAFHAQSVAVLYPYLRSAVTNLTAASLVSPLVLPIVGGALFPEDKQQEGGIPC